MELLVERLELADVPLVLEDAIHEHDSAVGVAHAVSVAEVSDALDVAVADVGQADVQLVSAGPEVALVLALFPGVTLEGGLHGPEVGDVGADGDSVQGG